jgi:hypothetical protein
MSDVTTGIMDAAEARTRIGGMEGLPSNVWLATLRVARISYDPIPYIRATKVLEQEARKALERSRRAFRRIEP